MKFECSDSELAALITALLGVIRGVSNGIARVAGIADPTSDAWFSVSESLPDRKADVLVLVVNRYDEPLLEFGFYLDGVWHSSETSEPFEGKVTHWRPFPKFPSEENSHA